MSSSERAICASPPAATTCQPSRHPRHPRHFASTARHPRLPTTRSSCAGARARSEIESPRSSMRAPATRAGRAPARINSTVDAEQPRVTRAWLESEPRWRIVDLPPFFRNHRASELRIRSGFRKLSVLLVVAEAKVSVFVHRPTSWFTWDRAYEIFSGSPENLGPVTDLQQIDSSSLLSGIIEVLSKHHWNDHDARDARRIRDKIIDLAREREQRLLALPPAVAIPWTDPV